MPEADDNQKQFPSHYSSYGETIKDAVWNLLDKNSILLPSNICRILQLDIERQIQYVRNLRSAWKHNSKKGHSLNRPTSQHGCYGWTDVPVETDRLTALKQGWRETKAKNRMLLWKNELGRLEWFPSTRRVNVRVRKPASTGKALQLLCNGFSWTGLIADDGSLSELISSFQWKGHHDVFETGQSLPRITITCYKESHGIVIKVGDISHPNAVEVISVITPYQEKVAESLNNLEELSRSGGIAFNNLLQELFLNRQSDRMLKEVITKSLHSPASKSRRQQKIQAHNWFQRLCNFMSKEIILGTK